MEFQELGEQKARNGSSSVGSSGSKGMSVVWENEVGDEADRWRLQRGLGATVGVNWVSTFPFFFKKLNFSVGGIVDSHAVVKKHTDRSFT